MHWHLPNPARNLAGAGLGRIWGKWPDFGFAGAGAEIQCNPSIFYRLDVDVILSRNKHH